MSETKPLKISETTLIPFSLLGAILAAVAGGTWWASAFFVKASQTEQRVSSLEANQQEIMKEVKQTNDTLIEIKTVLKQNRNMR